MTKSDKQWIDEYEQKLGEIIIKAFNEGYHLGKKQALKQYGGYNNGRI